MAWIQPDFIPGKAHLPPELVLGQKNGTSSSKANRSGKASTRKLPCRSRDSDSDSDNDVEIVSESGSFKKPSTRVPQHKKRKVSNETAPTSSHSGQPVEKELWIQKYSPRTRGDLAVNKKKVAEVESWMRRCQDKHASRILVLHGAAGAGKSACVRLLAKKMGTELAEWESFFVPYVRDGQNGAYESQESLFEQFLLRGSRYGSALSIPSRQNSEEADETASQSGSIILLEEIPQFCWEDPQHLHALLRRFVASSRTGLIINLTEKNSGNYQFFSLFPPSVVEGLGITAVRINPVIAASMRKILQAIAKKELPQKQLLPVEVLEELVERANGDVRAAVAALQFSVEISSGVGKANCSVPVINLGSRHDLSLILFRAVGRAFYVKRDLAEPVNKIGLPVHLLPEARHPLVYVPEEIIEHCSSNMDTYVSFLHDNYPYFYSTIHQLEYCSDLFSTANLVSANWTERDVLAGYGPSITLRGLMFLNEAGNKEPGRSRSFSRPGSTTMRKNLEEREVTGKSVALDLFPSRISSSVSIYADLFPYVGLIFPLRSRSSMSISAILFIASLLGQWYLCASETDNFLRDIASFRTQPSSQDRKSLKETDHCSDEEWPESHAGRSGVPSCTVEKSIEAISGELDEVVLSDWSDFADDAADSPLPALGSLDPYNTDDVVIEEFPE